MHLGQALVGGGRPERGLLAAVRDGGEVLSLTSDSLRFCYIGTTVSFRFQWSILVTLRNP